MAVRISSNFVVQRYQRDLNELDYTKTKLMEQSDGSKLHRPSDNSVDYSHFLRYNVSETENARYQKSVKNGISWMNSTQTALSGIEDIQKTFKARAIEAANDDKDRQSGDWQAIAKEMMAQIQQIVSLGNTQLGDRYIFSGQADLKQPFALTDEKVPRERGLTKTLDAPQTNFFNNVGNAQSPDFLRQMLEMKGSDGKTYFLNTLTGDVYSKEFVENGYKDLVGQGYKTVAEAAAAGKPTRVGNIGTPPSGFVSQNFKNTGEIISGTAGRGTNWSTTVGGVTMRFATIRQQLATYSGDFRYISMVKQNGSTEPTADTVNRTGEDLFGRDLFDDANSGNTMSGTAMLNNMLTVHAKTNTADYKWLSSDGVTHADVANHVTLQAHAKTGSRVQLYNDMTDILTNQGQNITGDITNVSSADVAELATKMMQHQAVMSMSLSMGARILPLSLVDYLR